MKRILGLIMIMVLAAGIPAVSANQFDKYDRLESRAQRAFSHGEWSSASALFDLMLEQQPTVSSTYGQAIVSNAMRNDTTAQMRLMAKALEMHLPFDSVFSRVRQWSFHLGMSHLYENFLKLTRQTYPWMRRTINGQLLRYYEFRDAGPEMIEYADIMLDGAPQNIPFLRIKAKGLMLTNRFDEAIKLYDYILTIDPENYETLLILGNWYAYQGITRKALDYLGRAQYLRPTPFVAATIASLQSK